MPDATPTEPATPPSSALPSLSLRRAAVARLGWSWRDLDPETGYLYELSDGRRKRVLAAGVSALNDAAAARLAGDKFHTTLVLREAGVRVPETVRCLDPDAFERQSFPGHTGLAGARELARRRGFPLLVKPNRGARGRDVTVARDDAELERAIRQVWRRDYLALVQELVPGEDLRLDFLDGEYLFGYRRRPLVLVGDGRATLRQLMRQADRRFDGEEFWRRLAKDPLWQERVVARGLGLDSVLPAGERLLLTGEVLNLNRLCLGRHLPHIAEEWLEASLAIGRRLHLRHFGIDYRIPHPEAGPREATVLEVNASPSLLQSWKMGYEEEALAAQMRVLEAILSLAPPG